MATEQKTIDPELVDKIFRDCLFNDDEDKTNYVRADGIKVAVGFHPQRLESHKVEILEMLALLPTEFSDPKTGGWTFLNACNDKYGNQWTSLHQRMDQLFMLGLAIKHVVCLLPRAMWPALPGGMPYYQVIL